MGLCPCGAEKGSNGYCSACHAAKQAEYRARDPERARETVRRANAKLRREMIAAYGGKCRCCGIDEPAFLTLEHKRHDRKEHMRLLNVNSCGVNLYRDLRRRGWPQEDYELLCMNCNFAMRLGGVCPHQVK